MAYGNIMLYKLHKIIENTISENILGFDLNNHFFFFFAAFCSITICFNTIALLHSLL